MLIPPGDGLTSRHPTSTAGPDGTPGHGGSYGRTGPLFKPFHIIKGREFVAIDTLALPLAGNGVDVDMLMLLSVEPVV